MELLLSMRIKDLCHRLNLENSGVSEDIDQSLKLLLDPETVYWSHLFSFLIWPTNSRVHVPYYL